MQPARLLQHLSARPQVKVVGVAQHQMRANVVLQQIGPHGLDGSLGADGHKNGRRNHAVCGMKGACPCGRMGVFGLDFELHAAKVRLGFLDYFCRRDECVV